MERLRKSIPMQTQTEVVGDYDLNPPEIVEAEPPQISPPKRLRRKRKKLSKFPHITLKRDYEGIVEMKKE